MATHGIDPQARGLASRLVLNILAGLVPAANKMIYFTSASAAALTDLVSQARSFLADPSSAYVNFVQAGSGAATQTVQERLRKFIFVSDFTGFDGTGATDSYTAFAAAVAAAPSTGAVILVPDCTAIRLDTAVDTGTKKILWKIGATTITGPQGDWAFILSANGSGLEGSGQDQTVIKLRAPASALVLPTVTTGLTAGALTTATPSGGSGFKSTPVIVLTDSPAADAAADDCAVVATVSGGTVSATAIVSDGAAYVSNPTATIYGGGHGAVKVDGVQGCVVRDFSIDFSSVAQSVGVYQNGGWWVNISNVRAYYDVATGVSTEASSSIGLMVNSYTLGAPGPTGSYGGAYVCLYSNLYFSKRGIVGHDTSTATTMQFSTCDFKNSFIHAAIGITDINPVAQASSGDTYNLVNVDGLTIIGGDFEGSRPWFHVYGSCSNIRMLGTLTVSASGAQRRGPLGAGWWFDFANSASAVAPLRTGSGGNAGHDYQNVGWNIKHRFGINYSGDIWTVGASNIKPTGALTGNLDDTSSSGVWLTTSTGGEFVGNMAYAGANPVTGFQLFKFDASGMYILAGGKVVGTRKTGWSTATGTATRTSFATSTVTLSELAERVKALIDDLHSTAGHGLIGT